MKITKGKILSLLTCSLVTLATVTPAYAGVVADNNYYPQNYNAYSYGSNSYSLSNTSNSTVTYINKDTDTSTNSSNETATTEKDTSSNTSASTSYNTRFTTYSISPTNSYAYGSNSYSLSGARAGSNTYSLSDANYTNTSTRTTSPTVVEPSSNNDRQGTSSDILPTYNMSREAEILFNLINEDRQKSGLKPLKVDRTLFQIAQYKSQDMYDNSYFSHTSPTFGKTSSLIRKEGISYYRTGENIGRTYSVYRAHNGFMHSPGHRANIMNPNFTHIGIGIAGNLYTELFIQKR